MITIVIGILGVLAASYFSVSGDKINLYWQWHSFWIVVAGTVSVLFLIFPGTLFKSLVRSLSHFTNRRTELQDYYSELQDLAKNRNDKQELHHPLLSYAQQLWLQGVSAETFIVLFSEKKNEMESANLDVIHGLRNLAKYPPALGMLGTVMGMIDLFSNLDKNHGQIGASLSMAMTSTLFGIIMSNIFISPVADRLHSIHMKEQRLNTSLYELILLINANQPLILIQEEIKNRAA